MRPNPIPMFLVATACAAEAEPGLDLPEASPLVVNEIVVSGSPDWFEVVNVSATSVDLSDYVFVDTRDDFLRAARFPDVALAPGSSHVQEVTRDSVGFALGKEDGLWIYRLEDHVLCDGATWSARDASPDDSLSRIPDVIGDFVVTRSTRGAPNRTD